MSAQDIHTKTNVSFVFGGDLNNNKYPQQRESCNILFLFDCTVYVACANLRLQRLNKILQLILGWIGHGTDPNQIGAAPTAPRRQKMRFGGRTCCLACAMFRSSVSPVKTCCTFALLIVRLILHQRRHVLDLSKPKWRGQ